MKDKTIGIDIGGTTIKMGVFNTEGKVLDKWEIPTYRENEGNHIVNDIYKSIINRLELLNIPFSSILGLGVGVPGFVDVKKGTIESSPNIPWRESYPLKDILSGLTGLPVFIENDANLAAIGEMWSGAGKGKKDILMITLGTGVGGGIITEGNVVRGSKGMGGEIGHMFAKDNEVQCGCGKIGCLETIASATGIARMGTEIIEYYSDSSLYEIEEKNGKIEAKDVFNEAQQGDPYAEIVVKEATKHLGIALSHLIHANNPEVVIIGGGVSKSGDYLLSYIKEHTKKYTLPRAFNNVEFKIASLGNDAGIFGGAFLSLTEENY